MQCLLFLFPTITILAVPCEPLQATRLVAFSLLSHCPRRSPAAYCCWYYCTGKCDHFGASLPPTRPCRSVLVFLSFFSCTIVYLMIKALPQAQIVHSSPAFCDCSLYWTSPSRVVRHESVSFLSKVIRRARYISSCKESKKKTRARGQPRTSPTKSEATCSTSNLCPYVHGVRLNKVFVLAANHSVISRRG